MRKGISSDQCTTILVRSPPLAVTLKPWPCGRRNPMTAAMVIGTAPISCVTSCSKGMIAPRDTIDTVVIDMM